MRLLLAGGGTAGHVEPAIATALGWKSAHPEDEIYFLGTERGLEMTLVPAAGFPLRLIPKVAIARKISPSLLKVPFQLVAAVAQSIRHLRGIDCAVGFGGYVSGPLYLAAAITRTPLVIHEQNAKPGWANRLGARLTKFTAISYPVHHGALRRAELTGLPLRRDVITAISTAQRDWIAARADAKAAIAEKYGFDSRKPLLFIFGGSQGSQVINAVIAAIKDENSMQDFNILHGVGKNNEIPAPTGTYRALPYIEAMAEAYLAADLLIARSGAVTCAEATALARFSLFIPLPIGNGEQALNAESLVSSGRAELIAQSKFTREWLLANIDRLIAQSHSQSVTGDSSGIAAVDKIVSIIERAVGK
jgi:UDP-N-acetylglucosamine--N-acetylmuramyl-(pentapeptide) pyrophosphoryl-undecaprenol N-acetylglucosamine transferase